MGKKKREHVVFDKMLVQKKSVPFKKINSKQQAGRPNNKV